MKFIVKLVLTTIGVVMLDIAIETMFDKMKTPSGSPVSPGDSE